MLRIPQDLLDGYRCFRAGRFAQEKARYAALSEHQAPHTLVIACVPTAASIRLRSSAAGRANSTSCAISRRSSRHPNLTGATRARRP